MLFRSDKGDPGEQGPKGDKGDDGKVPWAVLIACIALAVLGAAAFIGSCFVLHRAKEQMNEMMEKMRKNV